MLASLGKENGGADIKGVFELKMASRSKRQRVTIANLLGSPNKENKQLERDKSETDIIDMDDLSSISSVKSDNELWDCIEMGRGSKRLSRFEKMSMGSEQQRKNLGDLFYQSSENLMDKESDLRTKLERYEHTIEKMKDAQRLEIIAISENIRNKAKDMLAQKAEELKRNFEREIRSLVNQLTEAKRMLVIKENEITKLKELVQQHENSLNLIKSNSLYKLHPRTIKSSETGDESTFSKEELSALKKELESMKAILLTFKKDDEIKTRELAKARQEMNNMTRQHGEQIQSLTRQYEEKVKDSSDQTKMQEIKCQRVQKELEKFKVNADLEIKVLKALNERYKQKTDTSMNTTLPLKEVFVKARGSVGTDILNTSMASEATALQSRYSSQAHNTSFEHKGRLRASSKPRPGLDNIEAPSLTTLEPYSNGQSTANPKSKVTFLDSLSKNETGRNTSMEMR